VFWIARTDVAEFNIGINSGEAAGQTIFHCPVHLIPRRVEDVEKPRGGVRCVIPGKQKSQPNHDVHQIGEDSCPSLFSRGSPPASLSCSCGSGALPVVLPRDHERRPGRELRHPR